MAEKILFKKRLQKKDKAFPETHLVLMQGRWCGLQAHITGELGLTPHLYPGGNGSQPRCWGAEDLGAWGEEG